MEIILKHKGEKILFEGKVNLYTQGEVKIHYVFIS